MLRSTLSYALARAAQLTLGAGHPRARALSASYGRAVERAFERSAPAPIPVVLLDRLARLDRASMRAARSRSKSVERAVARALAPAPKLGGRRYSGGRLAPSQVTPNGSSHLNRKEL